MLTNQVVYSITILLDRGTVGFYASRSFYLAENTKICYTYDNLNRVISREIVELECLCTLSQENYTYDAAGNIINSPNSCFVYDTNNRLITFNGNTVSYDMDGNMLSNGYINCEFDSGNRLISAGGHTYTYNAEDIRIRNLCDDADTTYTYNTNCKLSQLLTKTTNGITTKYVYGHGLIGEDKCGEFKTYHFDYRGSTVAITDINGNITDTFKYDTYGNLTERTGNSFVIFGYNGRDGVVTDKNGLIYMRARYYSPVMRRFINADIIHGQISDSTSLNRYSYVNGNPVSFVDPFGLSAERGGTTIAAAPIHPTNIPNNILSQILYASSLRKSGSVNIQLFYYSEDYKNDATVTSDKNGNIIYTFSNHYDGLTHDNITVTKYYFEVKKASYWQELLDFEIKDLSILYDNGILSFTDEVAEILSTPEGGLPTPIEFGANAYEFVRKFLTPKSLQTIKHNSQTSEYLFDKVLNKDVEEKLPILVRAETYEYKKFFWQDSFTKKLTAERQFVNQ